MRTKSPLFLTLLVAFVLLTGCSRRQTRSDAQVASDVQNKIYSDSGIQSRQISVQAANGVVTLTGDVNTDVERTAAANDAGAIDGVKTVINNLQVQTAQIPSPPPIPPSNRAQAQDNRDQAAKPKFDSRRH